jgi:hypothetical protein
MNSRAFLRGTAAITMLSVAAAVAQTPSLWDVAQQHKDTLRISTLFTAQNVRDLLSSDQGIDKAIDWCKKTGVTRVFIESFRSGYTADKQTLLHAKARFTEVGLDVSGCVTTTNVGKTSTGWNLNLVLHRRAHAETSPGDLRVRRVDVRRDHDR